VSWLAAVTQTLSARAAGFSTSTEGHRVQPGGPLDYAITFVGAVVVLWVIAFAVARFVRPRETSPDHIKRKVLEESGLDV